MKSEFIQISLLLICTCTSLFADIEPQDINDTIYILENADDSDKPNVIKAPDQIEVQPTKIIHTSETQIETVIVDHIREHHLAEGQPPVYVDRYIVRKHHK